MTIKKKLFLDDVRDNPFVGGDWIVARTYEEAIEALASYEITHAWLDHDLTWEDTIGMPSNAKTGYDVVKWMEENDCFPTEDCMVHSMSPYGSERMCQLLAKHYHTTPSRHYHSAANFPAIKFTRNH